MEVSVLYISLVLRALLTCKAERRDDVLAQGVAVVRGIHLPAVMADRRDIDMALDDNRDGESIDGSVMSPMLDVVRESRTIPNPPRCGWCSCDCELGSLRQKAPPRANGCGAAWMPDWIRRNINPYNFRSCCNDHDRCYGDCGSSHSGCDEGFLRCMPNTCNKLSFLGRALCKGIAKEFHSLVAVGGCPAFKTAKIKHCECY